MGAGGRRGGGGGGWYGAAEDVLAEFLVERGREESRVGVTAHQRVDLMLSLVEGRGVGDYHVPVDQLTHLRV